MAEIYEIGKTTFYSRPPNKLLLKPINFSEHPLAEIYILRKGEVDENPDYFVRTSLGNIKLQFYHGKSLAKAIQIEERLEKELHKRHPKISVKMYEK